MEGLCHQFLHLKFWGAGEYQQLLKQRCAHGPQLIAGCRASSHFALLLLAFLSETPLLPVLKKTEG